MIRVSLTVQNDHILALEASGHANSDEYGKDLVCAAVSAILFGLWNAFDDMCPNVQLSMEKNLIRMECEQPDEKSDTIFKTGIIQLETVQETNKSYLKIKQLEV